MPQTVWLPQATGTFSDEQSDDWINYVAPISTSTVFTRYGRAFKIRSTRRNANYELLSSGLTLYEFHDNVLLRPETCPNIMRIEPFSPLPCEVVAQIHGSNVYRIHRRLPSEASEYFFTVNGTFVFAYISPYSFDDNFKNIFKSFSVADMQLELDKNSQQENEVYTRQKKIRDETTAYNALAYTRAPFTMLFPKDIPESWEYSTNTVTSFNGPNSDTIKLLSYQIQEKNKDRPEVVGVYVGKLSDFQTGSQCGPTPGWGMEVLPCARVEGTDFYEAITHAETFNDYARHLYRVVGDSIVITTIRVYADAGAQIQPPVQLMSVQDSITSSAQPTDKETFKNSTYEHTYY